jgi:hypothetical protein
MPGPTITSISSNRGEYGKAAVSTWEQILFPDRQLSMVWKGSEYCTRDAVEQHGPAEYRAASAHRSKADIDQHLHP